MKENNNAYTSGCSFAGVSPIMMALPYPPLQVNGKNRTYAELLAADYCGSVSEMSAIMQYINNENRLSCKDCAFAKTILGIAMAEMMHLQKLGELICLLGGQIDFTARQCGGRERMWTPAYLTLPEDTGEMLRADIQSERDAISQYKMHIKMIHDDSVNAVLARIIQDEEYHIMLLQALSKKFEFRNA